MGKMRHTLLLISACASVVLGQFLSYGKTTNNACADQIASPANATGVQNQAAAYANGLGLWNVAVSTDSEDATVGDGRELTATSPGAVADIWLDPFEDIHLTDGSNGFSACGFIFKGLPQNTILRGQDDDTSCTQTFSKKCMDAITSRAAETSKWLVENPTQGPFSNLTPPILNPICQDILTGIGYGPNAESNPFPSECAPFFDDDLPLYPSADILVLTSNVTGPQNCSFRSSNNAANILQLETYNVPPGLSYPFNSTNGSALASYDELVQQVWPVLTVTFRPANNSRQASVGNSDATMTCIRAGTVKAGSRVPASLPPAKAVHFPNHLSKGAIAGIVIGSVVGVALLGGLVWWIWRKRRTPSGQGDPKNEGIDMKENLPLEKGQSGIAQLDSKQAPAQLDGSQRAEMGHGGGRAELAGFVPVQELHGSTPVSSKRQ